MTKNILAADIGGTSARFGHFTGSFTGSEPGELVLANTVWLSTKSVQSFKDLLSALRAENFSLLPEKADICVFAVAGPIEGGTVCRPPNIAWGIDLRSALADFNIKQFALINDFLAQAFACRSPIAASAPVILQGTIREESAVAVVGAGTGLGKAILIPTGKGTFIGASSEGGHTNLAIEDENELRFQSYICERSGGRYATWDEVVSGRGLALIHEFLTSEKLAPEQVAGTFSEGSETLAWFSRFYGRVCRNFALETLSLGGLYIAGGVAAKNPIVLTHAAFADAFYTSRVHHAILKNVRVSLMADQQSGLWGAGFYGLQQLSA